MGTVTDVPKFASLAVMCCNFLSEGHQLSVMEIARDHRLRTCAADYFAQLAKGKKSRP